MSYLNLNRLKRTIAMIRYIVKVDYMPAVHLKLAQPLPAVQKVVITDYMPWQPLPIVGLASLEAADELQQSARVFTHKLACTIPARKPLPECPLVWRVTSADGTRYLLGSYDKPFPVWSQTDKFPDRTSDKTACVLTVRYASMMPLMEIVGE